MLKYLFVTFVIFFVSLSRAAHIIDFQNGRIGLRSDPPSTNFTALIFHPLKYAITACPSGEWKDWQTAGAKGRACDNLSWAKDLRSGCESIAIQEDGEVESWLVYFQDKMTCPTENLYFRKYSELNLIDELTYKYQITLKAQDAESFCNAFITGGAAKTETDGWTVWSLNDLAECRIRQNQIETLEATLNFQ